MARERDWAFAAQAAVLDLNHIEAANTEHMLSGRPPALVGGCTMQVAFRSVNLAADRAIHRPTVKGVDQNAHINRSDLVIHAVVGWLRIGDSGKCEGEEELHLGSPGHYLLSTASRHGAFARFRVTTGELPATGGTLADLTALAGLLVAAGGVLLWVGNASRRGRSGPQFGPQTVENH